MVPQIKDIVLKGKRVLIRVDFNVPMKEGQITDDSRIRAAVPTILAVINQGGKAIIISHLGRPKGVTPAYTLKPCADRLSQLLSKPVAFAPDCIGEKAAQAVASMHNGDVLILENVRFYDAEEHPEKDPSFVKQLAELGDAYINDAFGTAHRAHASTALLAGYFPGKCAAGMLMMKEVEALGLALTNPKRPFVAIIGGAKISTKLGVLKTLLQKADSLLIGGAMAYTFMRAMGLSTGASPVEETMLDEAKRVMAEAKELGKQLLLPVDIVVATEFRDGAAFQIIELEKGIPEGYQGMDIGAKTIEAWKPVLQQARTIFWNGPVGVFEFSSFAVGTRGLAHIVASCSRAFSIVGGGDSIAAIEQAGLTNAISHVSTGGGASLEFIEQGTLPGIEALEKAAKG